MTKDTSDKISVPFPEEPGAVLMTAQQWAQFLEKLGEACAFHLCERAEDYAEQWPSRWKKYKDHFKTLMNWHRMKVADGYEFYDHPQHGAGYYKPWVIDRASQPGVRR
jgi:hypothetical protein